MYFQSCLQRSRHIEHFANPASVRSTWLRCRELIAQPEPVVASPEAPVDYRDRYLLLTGKSLHRMPAVRGFTVIWCVSSASGRFHAPWAAPRSRMNAINTVLRSARSPRHVAKRRAFLCDTWLIPTSCPSATHCSLIELHRHPKNAQRLAERPADRPLLQAPAQGRRHRSRPSP